jgi:hypothetical protein
MTDVFPFGFAFPTALYLCCYVATLCIHLVLMSYTFAGAAYLAIWGLLGKQRFRCAAEIGAIIQDWLPFSLGLAITAGVAPLLFLQVLYQPLFYSANLLLSHRWMLMVPVLILGFYLLYLLKSDWGGQRKRVWAASAVAAFLCFCFVAWAWTENHLLSRASGEWVSFYASQHSFFRSPETVPRLVFWFLISVTILAVLLGYQLRYTPGVNTRERQRLVCFMGLVSLPLALGTLVLYASTSALTLQDAFATKSARPYAVGGLFGAGVMIVGWLNQLRRSVPHTPSLALTAFGMLLLVVGISVVREIQRLQLVDIATFVEAHALALNSGGMWAFLLFLVINGCLVAFALRVAGEAISRGSE